MHRHSVFFANPLRSEFFIQDVNFNFVSIDASIRKIFCGCCRQMPEVAAVFEKAPHVCAIFFRNDLKDEAESFRNSYERVTALIDALSLVAFEVPKLLPIAITACDGDQKAQIRAFGFDTAGRAFVGDHKDKFLRYGEFLLSRLLPAFDIASGVHAHSQTELAGQLSASAKMYRQGRLSNDVQMQFLSKFSAMEGLVCGQVTRKHGELLKTRLPQLFKGRLTTSRVEKLWKLRCRASHAGAGRWHDFSAALPDVELLATGCAIFAAAHVDQLKTVAELWDQLNKGYTLPSDLFQDVWQRNAIQRFIRDLGWLDVRVLQLDRIYSTA